MLSGITPGPGGFGPSPAFGRISHAGIHLVPAQTSPRPGFYNGPSMGAGHLPWLWPALLAVALLLAAFTASRHLRRR
jgi:hypothetical protein